MFDLRPATSHMHFVNQHTGRPRFHFDATSDAAAAASAAAASAAAAAAAKPWHDGVDAEVLGHWQNKGWKVDDPKEIALAATKQAREAERHFGVPVDRLLKLPAADAKPEEWAALHQRLGAPAKPEEYDFSTVKNVAGEAISQPLADVLRATAHANGLTKDAAAAVAQSVVKHQDEARAAEKLVTDGKIAESRLALEKNWGGKDSATYQLNHLKAIEGARKLGITPEGVKALEGQIGYDNVMETMRKIGAGSSEATFHEGSSGTGPTTREGAASRLAELEGDKAWGKRLAAGDAVATAEWRQLTALATGEAA
jgi:hypothetical protein